jgi:hypothetical protein
MLTAAFAATQGGNPTTTGVNTAGATLLVVGAAWYNTTSYPTISDSINGGAGNTWTRIGTYATGKLPLLRALLQLRSDDGLEPHVHIERRRVRRLSGVDDGGILGDIRGHSRYQHRQLGWWQRDGAARGNQPDPRAQQRGDRDGGELQRRGVADDQRELQHHGRHQHDGDGVSRPDDRGGGQPDMVRGVYRGGCGDPVVSDSCRGPPTPAGSS